MSEDKKDLLLGPETESGRKTHLFSLFTWWFAVCCLLDRARAEFSARLASPIEGTWHTVSWFSLQRRDSSATESGREQVLGLICMHMDGEEG
jgi:hypothetical protein